MSSLNAMVPYTCSHCSRVTFALSGFVAVTCRHCGRVDLGTELARDQWRTVAEVRLAQWPDVDGAPVASVCRPMVLAVVAAAVLLLATLLEALR